MSANLGYIARRYKKANQYERAEDIYQRLVQLYPESPDANNAQLDIAMLEIFVLIDSGQDTAAQAAIDKLLANPDDHSKLPEKLRRFARKYEDLKNHEGAQAVYQQIIRHFPGSNDANNAQFDIARLEIFALIDSGQDTAAQIALDKLIADFNDNPGLPGAVFVLGEEYYNRAFSAENEKRHSESKDFFRKAIAIWERIIEELPVDGRLTPEAYYISARCYERLGEKFKAVDYYQNVIDTWPNYQNADYAHYLMARCWERLARAGTVPRDDAARMIHHACEKLLAEYPDARITKAAENLLKRWDSVSPQ